MSGPFGVPQRPAVEVCQRHIEAIEAVMQAPGGCSETWLTPVLDLLYMVRNLAKADRADVEVTLEGVSPELVELMQPGGVAALRSPRQKAIGHLTVMVERTIGEFCIGVTESDRAYREARAAFNALGVTDEELGWDEGKGWDA